MKDYKKLFTVIITIVFTVFIVFDGNVANVSAAKLATTKMNIMQNQSKKIVIHNMLKNATYTFHSSNTKVAAVNSSGEVKGLKKGTAFITILSNYKKKTTKLGRIKITVITNPPTITPKPTNTPVPTQKPVNETTTDSSLESAKKLGYFNIATDLYIDHHDTGADLDDVHCMGAVGTMLTDSRFANVQYYCVTGTVKRDHGGTKTDAASVLKLVFPDKWTSAFENWDGSVSKEVSIIIATLNKGGDVWIAEGGSSDFTSDVIRKLKKDYPNEYTKDNIHVIQHNAYNQDELTTAKDLAYVKENTDYKKIKDGIGQFHTDSKTWWKPVLSDPKVGAMWKAVKELSDKWIGKTDYTNPTIEKGGMAFSDIMETAYIFGFDYLPSVDAFFKEFLSTGK